MRIVFISDTHNQHKVLTCKEKNLLGQGGDVLIHAGDCTESGKEREVKAFLKWFSETPFTHKVFIAGNHDFWFEKHQDIEQKYKDKGVYYLFDSMVELDNKLKIYGSPWQPEFYNWAFNLPRGGEKIREKWQLIPSDLDILITHGPAYGMVDLTMRGEHVGCEELFDAVSMAQPKIHACGHIHHSYGHESFNNTEFINACTLNEEYWYQNKPIVIDYDVATKTVNYI
jgi:Icc-related predicted phosphoesterase